MLSKTPADVSIEKRQPEFETTGQVSPWITDGPGLELFLDNLSCFFPQAEKFFIQSVSHYKKHINDKKLLDDVNRFIAQEAIHGIHHHALNAELNQRNRFATFPMKLYQPLLTLLEKCTSRRFQLAFTVCTEHFNAVYIDILSDNLTYFEQQAKLPYRGLWVWHTIEETEHKSVAFDVYMAVTKNRWWAYLLRVSTMAVMSLVCFLGIHLSLLVLFLGRKNKNQYQPSIRAKTKPWWRLKQNEFNTDIAKSTMRTAYFFFKHTLKHYVDFFRPCFHPWQKDSRPKLKLLINRYSQALGDKEPI